MNIFIGGNSGYGKTHAAINLALDFYLQGLDILFFGDSSQLPYTFEEASDISLNLKLLFDFNSRFSLVRFNERPLVPQVAQAIIEKLDRPHVVVLDDVKYFGSIPSATHTVVSTNQGVIPETFFPDVTYQFERSFADYECERVEQQTRTFLKFPLHKHLPTPIVGQYINVGIKSR